MCCIMASVLQGWPLTRPASTSGDSSSLGEVLVALSETDVGGPAHEGDIMWSKVTRNKDSLDSGRTKYALNVLLIRFKRVINNYWLLNTIKKLNSTYETRTGFKLKSANNVV